MGTMVEWRFENTRFWGRFRRATGRLGRHLPLSQVSNVVFRTTKFSAASQKLRGWDLASSGRHSRRGFSLTEVGVRPSSRERTGWSHARFVLIPSPRDSEPRLKPTCCLIRMRSNVPSVTCWKLGTLGSKHSGACPMPQSGPVEREHLEQGIWWRPGDAGWYPLKWIYSAHLSGFICLRTENLRQLPRGLWASPDIREENQFCNSKFHKLLLRKNLQFTYEMIRFSGSVPCYRCLGLNNWNSVMESNFLSLFFSPIMPITYLSRDSS